MKNDNTSTEDIAMEELPLNEERRIENKYSNKQDPDEEKTWVWRMKHDSEYRHKFMRTVCLWWSLIALGWTMSQTGPSFLDLQVITNSTLEKASAFLTAGSVGYLLGSMISGFLHNKIHGDLLLFICVSMNVAMSAIIPWCSIYEVMIGAMLIKHTFLGAWDTVGNAELIHIWGGENMAYFQAFHFCFAVGGIISPLVTAPFLITSNESSLNISSTYHTEAVSLPLVIVTQATDNSFYNASTENLFYNVSANIVDRATTDEKNQLTTSRLYLAYIITSCISVTSAILFLISFIVSRRIQDKKESDNNKNSAIRKLPLFSKILVIINLMFLMGVYVAVEETTMGFLTTFCVKQFHWTKAYGSYATSVFWASFAAGRFLGIFIIRCCSPFQMIITYILLIIFSFTGLLVTSVFNFSSGIWIFVPVSGLAMSVIFAAIFTWTENKILPVTGKIASLFLISASVGGMLNPLVIGTLMDTVTPMYFCYLLLGESIALFFLYVLAVIQSRRLARLFGNLIHRHCHTVDIPVDNENGL